MALLRSLAPLAVDVALPLTASVVVAHLGYGPLTALTVGAVIPVLRTLGSVVVGHRLNRLAALMLAVSVAGIVAGLLVADPRPVAAKDALVSAVIAVGLLLSTRRGTPIMSAGLAPFVTRGDPARTAAWERLAATSAPFRRLERRYTAVWGGVLLADCAIRVVAAFVVPVDWLSWIGGAITVAAIVVAAIASGAAAVEGLTDLLRDEVRVAQSPCGARA